MTDKLKIVLVYGLICLIWGSTWLAIRIGLESFTPLFSAGIRFIIAAIAILLIARLSKLHFQFDKVAIMLYVVLGLFSFVIPFGLVYWAEQFVPSGLAAVLFAVYPFFVAIFTFYLIKTERINFLKTVGMIISFIGIIVIFSNDLTGNISDNLIGMIAVVISAIMQAVIAVVIKKYGSYLHPLSMNFFPMLIGGMFLAFIGLWFEDINNITITMPAVLSILYLALFGSVITFTSYYWLMKKINIVLLSLISFITPVIAIIIGWIFYGESLQPRHIAGAVLVLAGIAFENLFKIFRNETSESISRQ